MSDLKLPFNKCDRCPLRTSERRHVLGDGNIKSSVLLLGEAPGENEVSLKKPFMGKAGQLLRRVLKETGYKEDEYFIFNSVLCRPPNNRDPQDVEIECCWDNVEAVIETMKPKVIIPAGKTALRRIEGMNLKSITNRVGVPKPLPKYGDAISIPIFHPSFVLRNGSYAEQEYRKTLAKVRTVIENLIRTRKRSDYAPLVEYRMLEDCGAILDHLKEVADSPCISFDTETTSLFFQWADLLTIGYSWDEDRGAAIPWSYFDLEDLTLKYYLPPKDRKRVAEALADILSGPIRNTAHNGKFDYKVLHHCLKKEMDRDFKVNNVVFDSMLAHHLLDENSNHGLDVLSNKYPEYAGYFFLNDQAVEEGKKIGSQVRKSFIEGIAKYHIPAEAFTRKAVGEFRAKFQADLEAGKHSKELDYYRKLHRWTENGFALVPKEIISFYCATDSALAFKLSMEFAEEIENQGLSFVMNNITMPISNDLREAEEFGVKVDVPRVKKLIAASEAKIKELEALIFDAAGGEFNINSGPQLCEVLFNKLGIRPLKKTATGWSADEESLKHFASQGYAIAQHILDYREQFKIVRTYVAPLLDWRDENDRIHANFKIHGTVTGRLSCTDPPLQVIPRDSEVRKVFICDEGNVIIGFDFAQAELRVLAFCSQDENLLRDVQFADVHEAKARRLFGISQDQEVPKALRKRAKGINFGIVYGAGPEAIAVRAECSVEEAKQVMKEDQKNYPRVYEWIKKVHQELHRNGQVVNLFGRVRRLPNVWSQDRELVAEAERQAQNCLIQGASADLCNLSAIAINNEIRRLKIHAKFLMNIHDAIYWEVEESHLEKLKEIAIREIKKPKPPFDMEMEVDFGIGRTWGSLSEDGKKYI